jgi:cytochrome P450
MFPDPYKIKTDRPLDHYIHYGRGPHTCWGGQLNNIALAAMMQAIAQLPNFRRAPGQQGEMKYTLRGPFRVYMNTEWSNYSPWPTSMNPRCNADSSL